MRILTLTLLACPPSLGGAEIYSPPANVIDPLSKPAPGASVDRTLPFVYIEPHDFCFDVRGPLPLTLYVVNRSKGKITVKWQEVLRSIGAEALGPGSAVPKAFEDESRAVELGSMEVAHRVVDLRSLFDVSGASVFRVRYVRPLGDGRLHVSMPVQFLVEDDAEVERVAAAAGGGDPALSRTLAGLLRDDPLFSTGVISKTYGEDVENWPGHPEMLKTKWGDALRIARETWVSRTAILKNEITAVRYAAVLETIMDHGGAVSGAFSCLPGEGGDVIQQLRLGGRDWPDAVRLRVFSKLAVARDKWLASDGINHILGLAAATPLLMRIADGEDRALAREALSALSDAPHDPSLAAFLRRKMADPDPGLALHAAIVSCSSGDWTGFRLILRFTRHEDPALRRHATGQLGDSRFRALATGVVPVLLERLRVETDPALIDGAIEALDGFPQRDVIEAVRGFLKHNHERVRRRAEIVLKTLAETTRERGK